jgi:hydroxylamine reductase (hybrid-cluster protein)
MQYQDLVQALMDAKAKAQIQGRPLSADEMRGVSGGYFDTMANRNLQGKALNLRTQELADTEKNRAADLALRTKAQNFQQTYGTDQLAQEKWIQQQMMDAADKTSRNQIWQNLIKTGGTLAMYPYYVR